MKRRAFLILAAAIVLLAVACITVFLVRTVPKTAEDYQARGLEYLDSGDYDSAIEKDSINTPAIGNNNSEQLPTFQIDEIEALPLEIIPYVKLVDSEQSLNQKTEEYLYDYYTFGRKMVPCIMTAPGVLHRMSTFEGDSLAVFVTVEEDYFREEQFRRINTFISKGEYDLSIAELTHAICLNPNDTFAYLLRGWVYNNRSNAYSYRNYYRTITDYTQAILLDPMNPYAYYLRGCAYYDKGDYDSAIADYETALRLEPNNAYAREWLEIARQARGR